MMAQQQQDGDLLQLLQEWEEEEGEAEEWMGVLREDRIFSKTRLEDRADGSGWQKLIAKLRDQDHDALADKLERWQRERERAGALMNQLSLQVTEEESAAIAEALDRDISMEQDTWRTPADIVCGLKALELSQLANACILRSGCTMQIFRGALLGRGMPITAFPSLNAIPEEDKVKLHTWIQGPGADEESKTPQSSLKDYAANFNSHLANREGTWGVQLRDMTWECDFVSPELRVIAALRWMLFVRKPVFNRADPLCMGEQSRGKTKVVLAGCIGTGNYPEWCLHKPHLACLTFASLGLSLTVLDENFKLSKPRPDGFLVRGVDQDPSVVEDVLPLGCCQVEIKTDLTKRTLRIAGLGAAIAYAAKYLNDRPTEVECVTLVTDVTRVILVNSSRVADGINHVTSPGLALFPNAPHVALSSPPAFDALTALAYHTAGAEIPQVCGFAVSRLLGCGRHGVVFADINHRAIKVVWKWEKWEYERQQLQVLNNAGVVGVPTLLSSGEGMFTDHRVYYLELQEVGEALCSVLRERYFEQRVLHNLAGQLSAILVAAHGVNVCHADIKPNNIVSVGNQFVLIDWGLSAEQQLVKTRWTRDFADAQPPQPSPRDDFWSLALTLHYLANVDEIGNVNTQAETISKDAKLEWATREFPEVAWPPELQQ